MSTKNQTPPVSPRGKLELTWTNKHLRLIDDLDGSYDWVDPSDWRVAEVRLLEDVKIVGEVHADDQRAKDNLLIEGDALAALRALTELPEFAKRYVGRVKLAYIDPPFNTGETFSDYEDNIEHSVWLTMMRDRLLQVRRLLRRDGSVWVHLDSSESHRARVVLDEVFGTSAYVGTVVWQKRTSRDNRAAFSSSHDYLLVYSPAGKAWKEQRNRLPDTGSFSNPDGDPRGPWRSVPMSAQAGRATASQFYTITTPTGVQHDPPAGRAWTYTRPRFEELLADNRIYWPRNGHGKPRLKRFPDESEGLVPFDLWPAAEVGENADAKRELVDLLPSVDPFDTPKPERLLERVLHVATDEGDVVLDCFAGSGTTAAVAHKMGRRWVTVERSSATVAKYTLPRLEKVVGGSDRGGISEQVVAEFEGDLPVPLEPGDGKKGVRALKAMREDDRLTATVANAMVRAGVVLPDPQGDGDDAATERDRAVADAVVKAIESELRRADRSKKRTDVLWSGGGGFRMLRVAPSMFEPDGTGRVYLAPWASCQDRLGQAVAAQLGYVYAEEGRFVGIKGRRRLAVIDGLVSRPVLEALAEGLPEGATMEVVGRAIADDAAETARVLAKGSKVRKIPSELLLGWRRTGGGRS